MSWNKLKNYTIMTKNNYLKMSLAYLLLLPVIVALIFEVEIVPLFVSDGVILENNPFLKAHEGSISPERIEQLRYILAIVSAPLVFTMLLLFSCQRIEYLTTKLRYSPFFYSALFIQLGLLIFCIYNGNIKNSDISAILTPYQPTFLIMGVILCIFFTLILHCTKYRRLVIEKYLEWFIYLIIIAYILVRLLPSIGFSYDFHRAVYMGEFSAILYGHTTLVDFFPQYQNLLAYLLSPVFYTFGFSYATFSLTMTLLAFIGIMLMVQVFRIVTDRNFLNTSLLVIPFISVIFFPIAVFDDGILLNTFTFAVIGSVRYLGWMIITYLVCKTLQRGFSYNRIFVLFTIGGLVAINNADFGIPSLVGSLAAVLLTAEQTLLPSLKTSLKTGIIFCVSVLIAVSLFIGFTYFRSGELPDITSALAYQRMFAYYGFGMYPMPRWGLQWLIYITFMAAIFVAVYKKLNHDKSPLTSQERIIIGLLIFSGVSGCGIAMYYVGRSLEKVMVAIFTAWSFSLLLLIWEQFNDWKNNWSYFSQQDRLIRYIPTIILLFSYCSFVGNILTTPSPFIQIPRIISSNDGSYQQTIENSAIFIKSNTHPGEKVTIIHNLGHEVADAAQVFNIFPYARAAGSLIMKDQINKIMFQIEKEKVNKIFIKIGQNSDSVPELLEEISKICTLSERSNAEWQYFIRKDNIMSDIQK